jgi:hypothetical protein
MTKSKWLAMAMAAVLALGLAAGCSNDDDDDGGGGGGSGASGSYAGTWTGQVCGRGLTMVVNQNGTALSGSFTFTNPTFSGTFSGSASSPTPPANARLNIAGHNWWFQLTFNSYNQLSGGFYKAESGGLVCSVSAAK